MNLSSCLGIGKTRNLFAKTDKHVFKINIL